jgi:hypothetical protein
MQGTFEFFANQHVHQWIVESMNDGSVNEIRVNSINY